MSASTEEASSGPTNRKAALEMQEEPELPDVPDADKPIVRNVIYTTWALHEVRSLSPVRLRWLTRLTFIHSPQGGGNPCQSWQVQNKSDGYLVLVTLPRTFTVTLQDLQLIADVNPLRIDLVMVRSPENAASRSPAPSRDAREGVHQQQQAPGSVDRGESSTAAGAVIMIKILDQAQPVRITEAEVVRVKKRHRGYLR